MKRYYKISLNLFLASIVTVLTLIIVFFLAPPWQKRLLDSALSRDRERQWQVGSVRIQPFSVELGDVFVMDGEVGAGAQYIKVNGPFWKLIFLGKLEIEEGSILGLDVDLSRIPVGDKTSEDYQAFLNRVAYDPQLWEERIGLLISKVASRGFSVQIHNTPISGTLLMPGQRVIPIRWTIVEASSEAPGLIQVEPLEESGQVL